MDASSGADPRDVGDADTPARAQATNVVGSSSLGSHQSGPPQRSPSSSSINKAAHRQSFAENLRNMPPSPRHRHPSLTQAAVQDLMNHPPSGSKHTNPRFAGRDWRDIAIGELTSPDDIRWIDMDSSVEEATIALLKSKTNVVLIREDASSTTAISTFDYSDLNAYLLVVVGLSRPDGEQLQLFNRIMSTAQQGGRIALREIQPICRQDPIVNVVSTSNLAHAIEILGSGIHRVLVTGASGSVVGVLSQLHMVDFFWNEGVNFPTIDRLYPVLLRDLAIGTHKIISVNSDAPLSDALILMNDEGLTSIAVVDNGQNVVGNISSKDVRHLTTTSSAPLLNDSCMHFISVILNERGVEKGQDTLPVFYVNPYSTLAHTVAKLVATRSHRMWVVESASPSPSAPATPLMGPQTHVSGAPPSNQAPPSPVPTVAVPASAMAGARISGKLSGVVSLTDILNMFAKFSGLHPSDPGEQRARRRRSSSSSVRPSLESSRASIDVRR
ncbi:cell separation during budding [Purpureocillium takamizusanense]|uniref:Protein SDS23 n=1 Tax=Purpureocillium takamizusanense TaxID=2060973 RepID=A0A9Q8QEJ5_9HYPO|nr:cell separation during budding [Purpureocillium takamizusanense]UNI17287.1 cell separation during budding [Purpureocillium takamizusanense]